MRNKDESFQTTMQEVIQEAACKRLEAKLLHPNVYNKLKEEQLSWSEFCNMMCEVPCIKDPSEGTFICQLEMLRHFRETGSLSEKAFPVWLKVIKEIKDD